MKPEDAVAVVTGARGAMAQAIMATLRQANFRTIGIDRATPDAGDQQTEPARWIECDLGSYDTAFSGISQLTRLVGHVDLLVNAAGSFKSDAEIAAEPDSLLQLFSDNIAATAWSSILCRPLLRNGRNSLVINIASTDGVVASGGQSTEVGVSHDTLYAASKGAVVAFTRALAMAWAPDDIRVNAICPTITRTRMTDDLLKEPGKEDSLAKAIPLGRICEPADIAAAVLSLIPLVMTTGHILTIDGGYLCV